MKCFWCEKECGETLSLIEHTKEFHPELSPRSYDAKPGINEALQKISIEFPDYVVFAFTKNTTIEDLAKKFK